MNLEEIKALCEKKEGRTVEFKASTGNLRAAFTTVCSFLNGDGGTVLFGVSDDGTIIGQSVSDGTRQEIANELKKIEPTVPINIEYIRVGEDKFVIAVNVVSCEHGPYVYDGRPFQRNESTTTVMTQHGYEQLLVERGFLNHVWEDFPASGVTIDDLDFDEINLAVQQAVSFERIPGGAIKDSVETILKRWNLIFDGKITNAAATLFLKENVNWYPQCNLKLGRFKGNTKSCDFIDNKSFYGNSFRILDVATSFMMAHLPMASTFKNDFFVEDPFRRIDKAILPGLALREALINAVCHKNYSDSSSIFLAIFDDRMEIWNSGRLPKGLKIEDLSKEHKSMPRNRNIAKVLYDRKYFDGWGQGTNKIFDLCKEAGVPVPEYEENSGGVSITFKFLEPIGVYKKETKNDFSEYKLNNNQKNILKVLSKEKAMTVREVATKAEDLRGLKTIGDDLAYLKSLNLVGLEGIGRGSRWFFKK